MTLEHLIVRPYMVLFLVCPVEVFVLRKETVLFICANFIYTLLLAHSKY